MCVCGCVCGNQVTNPFCFFQHVCLGRGDDSCSATDREGVAGWRGEERLKRKTGVFSIFDMQATGCAVQQLGTREFLL